MTTRRDFLRRTAMTGGGLMLAPWLQSAMGAEPSGAPPRRFIFMHKGNGLWPHTLVPPTLGAADAEKEKAKEAFSADLAGHELPDWMGPLAEHKSHLTILQGLSGKMCTTGHHTWQSSLGVYKANERPSSIKWATVDFELARLFPSPIGHIELACFPSGGGNARGNINGIETGFSARGPQQPNYAFGSPKAAMRELFKSVSGDRNEQIRYQLERQMLEFVAGSELKLAGDLTGAERTKVATYAESVNAVRERNARMDAMAEAIRRNVPRLEPKHLADDVSTVDRQWGHAQILLSTLISGLTNVVTFTVDELGTIYTGLPDLEKDPVNLHDVGHGKPVGSVKAEDVRARVRSQHMKLIDAIVRRLQSVPEGGGTMFDNTMLLYFPDNGETHHSNGSEWPFVVLAGKNLRLDIRGRYIRLPKHGDEGHKTLGNWYTTILNAYGNAIAHYGDRDPALDRMKRDQSGPIRRFLG